MKTLSIVTVTYNNQHQVNRYVVSLLEALQGIEHEIWIIDNASRDKTREELDKLKSVKKIYNPSNRGFGRANNQALEQVDSEYVLILNPDTILPKKTLHYLLK